MLPIHQEFTSSLQYAYDMGYITNMLQNKETQSNQSQGQNDQIQAFVDAQYKQIGASKEHKESEVARISNALSNKASDAASSLQKAGYEHFIFGKNNLYSKIISLDDTQKQELLDFAIKYNDVIMSSSELNEVFSSEISIKDFKNKVKNLVKNTPSKQINTLDKQNQNVAELDKQAQIRRNNCMLMRQYNGAKSRNSNSSANSEILKTFFEEFLKNNDPLKFLEFMKKTDIRA